LFYSKEETFWQQLCRDLNPAHLAVGMTKHKSVARDNSVHRNTTKCAIFRETNKYLSKREAQKCPAQTGGVGPQTPSLYSEG